MEFPEVNLLGSSAAIRSVAEEIGYAARASAKVLITGESGVGKEIVAHMIHRASARSRAPIITINCAGVPDTLLESELFGHVRGSFTGAYRDKRGLLETAHGGSVFLDEIGEMSLRMQAVLLRFIESGEIQRVGSDLSQARVDVRVIAATNRLLLDRVATKEFREDLYYRLNVVHVVIPPLRERREDILPLFAHFLGLYAAQYEVRAPNVAPDAVQQLEAYCWPGNVRELKNLAERLIVRGTGATVTVDVLPIETALRRSAGQGAPAAVDRESVADQLFDRMVRGSESFWSAVYPAFMSRDLTRDDIREIVGRGLEHAHGSYKIVVELFNVRPDDYKRFLNFLRKHNCHMPFHKLRSATVRTVRASETEPDFAAPSGGVY